MTPEKRELLRTLESRFTSGNDVPVTRAMITREEYEQLRSLLTNREGFEAQGETPKRDGFVWVPREPTEDMLRAAQRYGGWRADRWKEVYAVMIAAVTKEVQ